MSEPMKRNLHDRQWCKILVVSNTGAVSMQMRQLLKAMGFAHIAVASTHIQGLDRAKTRNFTHVMFDAKPTDMPTVDFVQQMLAIEEQGILVAISDQPRIDDVFGLLRAGARGFLVPPFTVDNTEEVLIRATEGPALSEAVLNAPDRNGAFAAVILNNLYRVSVAMRQAREFETAARDATIYMYALRESIEMGLLFCQGGEAELRDKIAEGCINRAKDAATRLGRLRKKLKRERGISNEPELAAAK